MARDEAAIVRCQEKHGTRDLFETSQAPERNPLDYLCLSARGCIEVAPDQTCLGATWRDDVHADTAFFQIVRPAPCKGANRCLAGIVERLAWICLGTRDRAVEDNHAPLRHQRQCLLYGEDHGFHIDAER